MYVKSHLKNRVIASVFMALLCLMNIQVAVLCDAATDNNGRLSLLGAFDSVGTGEIPQCSIALRMAFTNAEEGGHQVRINFVDADGMLIMPCFEMPIQVSLPDDVHFYTENKILNLQQLNFEKPGLYSIDISVDGRQETSIPLMVH
jgi:hypothetical protein